jgi:hypothetical protein
MFSGCTTLNISQLELPPSPFSKPKANPYPGIQTGFEIEPEAAEQVYNGVREAKARNAVVLQVVGDSSPVRVLPLPQDGRSVTVSTLLSQTQVTKKMGAISATLYRPAADSIAGMPLEIKLEKDGRSVRPETDYALHAGDRLRVGKAVNPVVQDLVNAAFGL